MSESKPKKRISHHGERQRQRILAILKDGPMSAVEIAERIHMGRDGVLKHMLFMREETPRRIYISSYVINGVGRPTPQYAAGNALDVPYEHMTLVQSHHQDLLSRLVMQLEKSPRTTRELSQMMGLSMSGVHKLVNELRKMGWCYIGGWGPLVNRNRAPLHTLGIGKDKSKPVKTRAERWKEEKRDVERHSISLAKRFARNSIKKAVSKKSSIFAALGL